MVVIHWNTTIAILQIRSGYMNLTMQPTVFSKFCHLWLKSNIAGIFRFDIYRIVGDIAGFMWPLLDLVTIKSFSTVHARSSFGKKICILLLPPINSWAFFTIIFPIERLARIIHRANLAFFIAWGYLAFFKSTKDIFKPFSDYFGRPFVVFSEVTTTILAFINSILR